MWEQQGDRSPDFRFAGLRDVEAIVELVESAYRGDSSRVGWTTEADLLTGQRTDVQTVRRTIEQVDSLVLLACSGEAIVGCCLLVRRNDESAYFGMFAIRPGLQANGLGTKVLSAAERIARERWGARTVKMSVIRQRRELIAWYCRKGYEPTGETEPFPYGDERFGIPLRTDLEFLVLEKSID